MYWLSRPSATPQRKPPQKTESKQSAFNKPSLKQRETPTAAQSQPKKLADDDIKLDKSKASIKQRLDVRGFNQEMKNIEKSLYAWD